ncbi:MAG: hypothetical protein RBT36_09915 [Desulfobulbus sp.]|jgi:hypothetical protein|nr:hypothetical protein [Desulfobulbus sp.]
MKTALLALTVTLLAGLCPAWAETLPWETKLPFKEATIIYRLEGSEQGEEKLFIKEYGKIRAKHRTSTTTVMGMNTATKLIEITDGDWVTTYDLVERSASRITNPGKLYNEEYTRLSDTEKRNVVKNAKQLGGAMMGQFGGSVKQSPTKILGYDCDVTSVGNMSTVHLLRGTDLMLRSQLSIMGLSSTVTATSIDTATPVPASAFALPAGITATVDQQAEEVMAQTVRQMIATLKSPEGVESLKKAGGGLLPAGLPQSLEKGVPVSKEDQQRMRQEMEQGLEMLKKMLPQQ